MTSGGPRFRVGERPSSPDFVLSGCRTPREVASRLQQALDSADRGGPVVIVLDPPLLLAADLSIPRAFRVLVGLLSERTGLRDVEVHVEREDTLDLFYRHLPPTPERTRAFPLGRVQVEFVIADLVEVRAEAIVNASNRTLTLGGGVSGAIREAASGGLQAEMHRIAGHRNLADGDVAMTDGFGLPHARRILHVVTSTDDPEVIVTAVRNSLALCEREGLGSVALPALGTGTRKLQLELFIEALHSGITSYLDRVPAGSLKRVVVAAWTKTDFDRLVARWASIPS